MKTNLKSSFFLICFLLYTFYLGAQQVVVHKRINTERGENSSLAISPDSRYLAVGMAKEQLKIWELESGAEFKTISVKDAEFKTLNYSPEGRFLLTASNNDHAQVISLSDGSVVSEFKDFKNWLRSVAYSPDGKTFVSASDDKLLRVVDASSLKVLFSLKGHDKEIYLAKYTPDGKYIVSGSEDESLRIWNVAEEKEVAKIDAKESIESFAISPDGKSVLFYSKEGAAVASIPDGRILLNFKTEVRKPKCFAYAPSGNVLTIGGESNFIELHQLENGELIQKIGLSSNLSCFAFSPDSRFLAVALEKDSVVIFNSSCLSLKGVVKQYVERNINTWQLKGKYEKTVDYMARVNEKTRKQKIEKLSQNAIDSIGRQQINIKTAKLEYDADNESYKLSFEKMGYAIIKVPVAEAESFEKNFKNIEITNSRFTLLKDNSLNIVSLELRNAANRKNYFYNNNNAVEFNPVNISFSFQEVEISTDNGVVPTTNVVKSRPTEKSDVDVNIPKTSNKKSSTYALIIGNEDYKTFQPDLETEVNVDFAMNDAKVFKEYVINTLGVPEKQTKLLINATAAQISQGIAWISNLVKIEGERAEVIFYYSGHGLPDEQSKEPYIIPVDVSGANVSSGIKINDIYNKLTANSAKRVSVFIDACFSGGARNAGLVAMKSVKILPKEESATGRMFVFTSSSGEESSAVYREKQHGYFTYFLLKKLQETAGKVSYKELVEDVTQNVRKETGLISKKQTPKVTISTPVVDQWKDWSFE